MPGYSDAQSAQGGPSGYPGPTGATSRSSAAPPGLQMTQQAFGVGQARSRPTGAASTQDQDVDEDYSDIVPIRRLGRRGRGRSARVVQPEQNDNSSLLPSIDESRGSGRAALPRSDQPSTLLSKKRPGSPSGLSGPSHRRLPPLTATTASSLTANVAPPSNQLTPAIDQFSFDQTDSSSSIQPRETHYYGTQSYGIHSYGSQPYGSQAPVSQISRTQHPANQPPATAQPQTEVWPAGWYTPREDQIQPWVGPMVKTTPKAEKKAIWSDDEDSKLVRLKMEGTSLKDILPILDGRSSYACSHRWQYLLNNGMVAFRGYNL